jgi:hypothetical protein
MYVHNRNTTLQNFFLFSVLNCSQLNSAFLLSFWRHIIAMNFLPHALHDHVQKPI